MRVPVQLIIFALLAWTSVSFSQPTFIRPAQFNFEYPGDWDCENRLPLTYGACFDTTYGIPIPDGTSITVFVNGWPYDFFPMNSSEICFGVGPAAGGFFVQWYMTIADPGNSVHLEVEYNGCRYWTNSFALVSGPQAFTLSDTDWNCDCLCLVISINNGNAVLNWFPFSGATAYNIYGATEPSVSGDWLDTVADTTWTDWQTSSRPSRYFYYVKMVE